MSAAREWTITQRAYRLGKLMSRGERYTTAEIREMLGYSSDGSVYNMLAALIDEPVERDAEGYWSLAPKNQKSQNSLSKHLVSK